MFYKLLFILSIDFSSGEYYRFLSIDLTSLIELNEELDLIFILNLLSNDIYKWLTL